jgi:hypothetical protein
MMLYYNLFVDNGMKFTNSNTEDRCKYFVSSTGPHIQAKMPYFKLVLILL